MADDGDDDEVEIGVSAAEAEMLLALLGEMEAGDEVQVELEGGGGSR